MEAHRISTAATTPSLRRASAEPYGELPGRQTPRQSAATKLNQRPQPAERTRPVQPAGSLLVVGAKTLTGIGIGLLFVFGGAALLGIAAESVIVPSLLVKMAGGVAGGGLGLSKGVKDMNKQS